MKVKLFLFSILVSFSLIGFSQVYQNQSAPMNFVRGTKNDTILVIPRGCDTVALPGSKFGARTIGAVYYDTCANTLYVKGTYGWLPVTGGLDSLQFEPVIDSTGNLNFRVLYAQDGKITGESAFVYRPATNTLRLNYYSGSTNNFSIQAGDKVLINDSLLLPVVETHYDTTDNKPATIDANGVVKKLGYWPAGGGGDTTGLGNLYIRNQQAVQENKRANIKSILLDSLSASTSAGLNLYSHSGSQVANFGAGGGNNATFNGGVNIDGTTRLATSLTGILKATSGTVSTAVSGTDIKTINGGTLLGSGDISLSTLDSVAIRRSGILGRNFRSYNAGLEATGAQFVNQSSTTADSMNLAIGYRALEASTSGYRNIALGDVALSTITTGGSNIAIGYRAIGGTGTKTGDNNIGIGNNALSKITTPSHNIAIGNGAADDLVNGDETVAIGWDALGAATEGQRNTAVGSRALLNITKGLGNVGVGDNVGLTGGNISYTTFVGNFSGYAATGSYNSGFGRYTLNGVTGVNNLALGYYTAGLSPVTGNNNIVIGAVGKPISYSGNNQVSFWVAGSASASPSGGYNVLSRNSSGQWIFNQTTSEVTTIGNGAAVEINGTTGGILIPRLTTTQQNAIASPATGLLVWNTDSSSLCQYTGSAWQNVRGGGAATGITSLNGLTGATQTFATGTSGTDFGISSSGTTHTFNLPTASASNRGALSSADWSTFNGKQAPPTWVDYSGTSTVVGWSSFTTKVIRYSISGKQCTVNYYIEGTSDATSITFTLANAIGTSGVTPLQGITYAQNNGSPAIAQFSLAGSTVTLSRFNAIGSITTWTNSGTKRAAGTFTYEID